MAPSMHPARETTLPTNALPPPPSWASLFNRGRSPVGVFDGHLHVHALRLGARLGVGQCRTARVNQCIVCGGAASRSQGGETGTQCGARATLHECTQGWRQRTHRGAQPGHGPETGRTSAPRPGAAWQPGSARATGRCPPAWGWPPPPGRGRGAVGVSAQLQQPSAGCLARRTQLLHRTAVDTRLVVHLQHVGTANHLVHGAEAHGCRGHGW